MDSARYLINFKRMAAVLLGAIGVSGSTIENDLAVVQAAIAEVE